MQRSRKPFSVATKSPFTPCRDIESRGLNNRRENRFNIPHDFVIQDAKDVETERAKKRLPSKIIFSAFHMTFAVEFNDELLVPAEKVNDVWLHRRLAEKLQSGQLSHAQDSPQLPFRDSGVPAQFAGACLRQCSRASPACHVCSLVLVPRTPDPSPPQ